MDSKRTIVETVNESGEPIKLAVMKPTNRITQEANMAYNLKMAQLIRQGAQNGNNRLLMRAELEDYLIKAGIWSVNDALEVEKIALKIRAHELMLKKGGLKISEGRALALQMAEMRQQIMIMYTKRQQFDSATIESHAENFRFEFLMVHCVVIADTGKKYLKDHEEYIERQGETAIVACAKALANIVYQLDSNIRMNMFEMQWLQDAGFVDKDGQYRNKDGQLTDRDGRLINDDGKYINEEGQIVDHLGRAVDEKGNLLVETSKPFIDDETGETVVVSGIGKKVVAKAKKKTKTTKKGKKKTTKKLKG